MPEEIEKLEYIYQPFQDHEKVYESDPQVTTEPTHDTLDTLIVIILIVRLGMISNVQLLKKLKNF